MLLLCTLFVHVVVLQVEASIPTPKRETEKPFLMPVEDIFSISGRGTVATGRIEQGHLTSLPPSRLSCGCVD